MKRPLFLIVFLFAACFFHKSIAQQVTFNGYPDLHFKQIVSLDIDDDAVNALSLDLSGRTIFWDLESQKPLRIWQHAGVGIKTKMIFDEFLASSVIKGKNDNGEDQLDIVLYDLFEGNIVDTVSLQLNSKLLAFDFSKGAKNKQECVFLLESKVVCVDLLRRKIKWESTLNVSATDINYGFENSLLITAEEGIYKLDPETQNLSSYTPSHFGTFDLSNVRGNYHIVEKAEGLEFWDISNPSQTYPIKLNGVNKLNSKDQLKVLNSSNCSIVLIDRKDKVELYKLDPYNEIEWQKPFEKKTEKSYPLLSLCYASNANFIAHIGDKRDIVFLDGLNGEQKTSIKNEIPDTRLVFTSTFLNYMLYSDLGDGDDGSGVPSGQVSSYFVDMVFPSNPIKISNRKIKKAAFSYVAGESEGFYVLDDEAFSFFDVATARLEPFDLNDRLLHPIVGKVVDFDVSPYYLLLQSKPSSNPEVLEINDPNALPIFIDGKQVGVYSDGEKIYGSCRQVNGATTNVTLDKEVFILYDMYLNELIDVILPEEQNIIGEIKNESYCSFLTSNRRLKLYDIDERMFVDLRPSSRLTNVVADKTRNQTLLRYLDQTCLIMEGNRTLHQFKLDAIPVMLTFSSETERITFKKHNEPNKLFAFDYIGSETREMDGVFCTKFEDISSDGGLLALSNTKAIQLIDINDGSIKTDEVKEFEASPAFVKIYSEQGMALSGRYSGRLQYWDLAREKVHATFLLSPDGKYVAYNDMGKFDCHPDAMDEVYYTVRKEIVELEQLKDKYWDPGFWVELPAFSPDAEAAVKKLNSIPLYPDVKLTTSMTQDELFIELFENDGGIGYVSFFINNVEVEENVNPNFETSITVPLKDYEEYLIPNRPNILGVVVYNTGSKDGPSLGPLTNFRDNGSNKKGWLRSRQKRIPIEYGRLKPVYDSGNTKGGWEDEVAKAQENMLDTEKTRLIGLVIGTSDYEGGEIDLRYADNDANSMENALKKTGLRLFEDQNKVMVKKLISRNSDASMISTRENIKKVMTNLEEEVKVDDILVVFFSGHGLTYKDEYYYASKEANGEVLGVNPSEALVKSSTISATEINDFLKKTKSLRKLLIFDACYSGSFAESLMKSGNSSQRKAMSKLKDKTGVYILSSSLGSQKSVELPSLSQGVMTYSLLDGMSGKAAVDNVIEVTQLIEHVVDHVPPMAQQKGYVQQPVFMAPEASMSFAIGLSDESIAPTGSKVQIGRSSVEDSIYTDYLLLNEVLDEAIKVKSEQEANVPFMFNELVTKNNVVIKGDYKEENGLIVLKAAFIRNNTALKKIKIAKKTAKEVAEEMVKALTNYFREA